MGNSYFSGAMILKMNIFVVPLARKNDVIIHIHYYDDPYVVTWLGNFQIPVPGCQRCAEGNLIAKGQFV